MFKGATMPRDKDWTFTETQPGVIDLEGSPLQIRYNTNDPDGAPAELWWGDERHSIWAALNVAKDMALKQGNYYVALKKRGKI